MKTLQLLSCDSESSKKRWIEAMSPPISSNPDETLYNEWDCPQVFVEHAYTAIQPDELSLQNGDIVKVLTKMNDGRYLYCVCLFENYKYYTIAFFIGQDGTTVSESATARKDGSQGITRLK